MVLDCWSKKEGFLKGKIEYVNICIIVNKLNKDIYLFKIYVYEFI